MKKLLGIVVLGLLLSGNAYADQRCTQERQDWIVHLKKQLEAKTEDIKWKDDLCYASISHVKGIPIEEHLSTIEEENNDKLVRQIDLFNNEDLKPKDINWVPEDFRQ
ncbi:hypothetical protein [Candidatus Pelagibacter sp. Uisw_137]|uniref:hypothetical protein n=1 Tax=Candidatus Pelagibacter sp. Uisw_137 TaxID=3230992 RepID=UPI0039EB66D1